uniref:Uncharacterized protein n=1 Tax=Rhizophora mucronata TaxID=61149 RepID=A0A2P2IUM6_RHIMU
MSLLFLQNSIASPEELIVGKTEGGRAFGFG